MTLMGDAERIGALKAAKSHVIEICVMNCRYGVEPRCGDGIRHNLALQNTVKTAHEGAMLLRPPI